MPLTSDTKYPSRRAYVVKLRGDAAPRALAGRVENLVTGRHQEFDSAEALLEILASDLETVAGERAGDD